jgi:hypothetical protein
MPKSTPKKHRYVNLKSDVHERLNQLRLENSKKLGVELSWSEFLSNLCTEYCALSESSDATAGKGRR